MILRCLLTLMLCTSCVTSQLALVHTSFRIEQVQHPVYKLQDIYGSASGFVVACNRTEDGYRVVVMTAGHVVRGGEPPFMLDAPGTFLTSAGISVHPTADVALIEFFTDQYHVPRVLHFRQPTYGEELWLEGYPAGEGPFLRKGYASGGFRTSTPAWPGDSGGPISDVRGNVLGMLVQTFSTEYGLVPFAARMVVLADISDWLGKELHRERFAEQAPRGEVQPVPSGRSDLGEPGERR